MTNSVAQFGAVVFPEEREKNYEIEFLRAVAILFVLFQHSFNYLNPWQPEWPKFFGGYFSFGQAGVDLFLVISGYVIAKSSMNSFASAQTPLDAWKAVLAFWIKRIYRLQPTVFLWIAITIFLSFCFNNSTAFGDPRQAFHDGIAAILQIANLHVAYCAASGACFAPSPYTLGPLWSLSLEQQFYFLFPLLIVFLAHYNRLGLLIYLLFVIALAQIFLFRPDGSLILYVRSDALCGGVIIYLASSFKGVQMLKGPLASVSRASKAAAAIVLFFLVLSVTGRVIWFNAGVSAILCTMIVFLAHFNAGWFAFSRGSATDRVLMWIAERSFSLYVTHCVCIALTRELWWFALGGREPTSSLTLPFYVTWVILMILVSELNWRFIEKPFREKGRAIAANWRQAA